MAQRGYLILTPTGGPLYDSEGQRIPGWEAIAECNWIVPVLWCSIFNLEDIGVERWTELVDFIDGKDIYAEFVKEVLSTPLTAAAQRARDRRARFFEKLPWDCAKTYDEWLRMFDVLHKQYLPSDTTPYIRFDTGGLDLQSHMIDEDFDYFIRALVSSFEHGWNGDWANTLEWCAIPIDYQTRMAGRPIEPHKLRGYTYRE